ncbi:hypothetical protein BC939DRAFT_497128 [Gamsiella multidivaricata]|uniref:uncharacterized protein n=1 Tax=Gamsiella multidivaricata TaxID=101098 RepID=UPI00221F0058|nr:uncharacterized protein BC939DRAFT_497128 [Gamsiella multidivaricata]KAI7816803.1 hypothetical protein BC939DRAFT_497128 [Gamsiella multidivaricata]
MVSDPVMGGGLLSTSALSSGTNSPSSGVMVSAPGYSNGFNTPATIIKPTLSAHSSTSSVPSLSMMMGNATMASLEGQGVISMSAAFPPQAPQQANMRMSGMTLSSSDSSHRITPTGSPGFQAAVVPSSAVAGPAPIPGSMSSAGNSSVPMAMPMPLGMNMAMVMGMNSHPGHGVSSPPPPVLSPTPPVGAAMGMVHNPGTVEDMSRSQIGGGGIVVNGGGLFMTPTTGDNGNPHGQEPPPLTVSMSAMDTSGSGTGPVAPVVSEHGFSAHTM